MKFYVPAAMPLIEGETYIPATHPQIYTSAGKNRLFAIESTGESGMLLYGLYMSASE